MEIKQVTLSELIETPGFLDLVQLYEEESRNSSLPPCNPDYQQYTNLENLGAASFFKAEHNSELIGFSVLIVSPVPHYSALFGVLESLFVHATKRKTGAGLKLIRAAEKVAKSKGCLAVGVSAPVNGVLSAVLNSSKYTLSNLMYLKVL